LRVLVKVEAAARDVFEHFDPDQLYETMIKEART